MNRRHGLTVFFALAMSSSASAAVFNGSSANRQCHFCRYTQLGFLRLANNFKVFPHAAVTQDQAWEIYDHFLLHSRTGFAVDSLMVESTWRQFTRGQSFAPKLWNDAYLVAFAQAAGFEVVTFDQGFKQFPSLKVTILT